MYVNLDCPFQHTCNTGVFGASIGIEVLSHAGIDAVNAKQKAGSMFTRSDVETERVCRL